MVTMSAIWDRTAEVLRGRGSMLVGIAGLLIFLPTVASNAVATYGGKTPPAVAVGGLLALAAGLMTIWGNLALVAATSDPSIDRPEAIGAGARRLGPAVGLSLLLGLVVVLVAVPGIVLLVMGSGANATRLATMTADDAATFAAGASPGLMLAGTFYLFLFGLAAVWLSARLALFWPVVVNERRGVGSFARSFALTRGLTWRIIGVFLLFLVLLLVALGAAQLVGSVLARLLLGASGVLTAQFIGAVAGAAVTAGGTVVSATFVTQLYRVVSGQEAAHAFA